MMKLKLISNIYKAIYFSAHMYIFAFSDGIPYLKHEGINFFSDVHV